MLSMTESSPTGPTPQVVRRLRAVLDELELALPVERQPAIARQQVLLQAAVESHCRRRSRR